MVGITVTEKERRAPTVMNEWFAVGRNLIWVIGLIITGTLAFNNLQNRNTNTEEKLTRLEDKVKEAEAARILNSERIQAQLAAIREQQTQLLVAIEGLKVTVSTRKKD